MNRESNICNSCKKNNFGLGIFVQNCCQPLREAVSWNSNKDAAIDNCIRQPLREAVSWNKSPMTAVLDVISQPLREAVSWNVVVYKKDSLALCQPLREAVSWNTNVRARADIEIRQPLREAVSWNNCALVHCKPSLRSASSWGCELKYISFKMNTAFH